MGIVYCVFMATVTVYYRVISRTIEFSIVNNLNVAFGFPTFYGYLPLYPVTTV